MFAPLTNPLKKISLRLLRRLAHTKTYQTLLWSGVVGVGVSIGFASLGFVGWPLFFLSALVGESIVMGGFYAVFKAGDRYAALPVRERVLLLEEHQE